MMPMPRSALTVLAALALARVACASNEFGVKFLEENKGKEGVITLPSGLQYKVLRKGDGTQHPTADSPCDCHYEGRTAQNYPDGPVFDSSYARGSPTTFAPNQVIKGWTEAMQLMVEGDKWEMYIPSELGYGDRGSPPKIGGGDVLVFTMEIINIKGPSTPASKCDVASGDGCTEAEDKYRKGVLVKSIDDINKEIARLEKLVGTANASPDKLNWMRLRLKLLRDGLVLKNKEEL